MAITAWKPNTQVSRGNVSVNVSPVVVDINAPKLSELTTGVGIECSINTFNGTSSTDSETVDWLCDPVSEQLPGSTTHTIDDLVIKTTGQADSTLVTALKIGDIVYFWRRDGIATSTAPAAAQMVWVWKAQVTSIDPLEANNVFIGITAHINVLGRSKTAVAIAAN